MDKASKRITCPRCTNDHLYESKISTNETNPVANAGLCQVDKGLGKQSEAQAIRKGTQEKEEGHLNEEGKFQTTRTTEPPLPSWILLNASLGREQGFG